MSTVFNSHFVPWFRSVAPYIHKFRHQTFVIGLCGEAIVDGMLQSIVQDLALVHSMGVKIVLIHGFRPQVDQQLKKRNHPQSYYKGNRITDAITLSCAQEAAGQLRYEIEACFSQGLPNTPMAGSKVSVISGNFITARPMGILDGVDFLHTGKVRKVDVEGIHNVLNLGSIVVLSPFGYSPTGEAFNLAMEEVACSLAGALKADKLIYICEQLGIPENPGRPVSEDNPVVTEMNLADAKELLKAHPNPEKPSDIGFYLKHCIKACETGVERSHIIPYKIDGSILLEVYVHDGFGTMIVDEGLEEMRQAIPDDVGAILQLIEPFEEDGTLVKRSRTDIERDIANYTIIDHDGVVFGCAALYPYFEQKTGEMAALTVSPSAQGHGDGEKLLRHIEKRAKALGLTSIFVLTTHTMHWFLKRGFAMVDPEWLPEERKGQYNWSRKSRVLAKKL